MTTTDAAPETKLHRALGLRDLVLFDIACIVGLSSIAQVAQFGFGSIALYLVAVAVFLVPSGLMVAELNARLPEEGGFYRWTRTAFGDAHGFVAAWCYWVSNIVWLPTVLVLVSMIALRLIGGPDAAWAEDPWHNAIVCLAVLWATTALNIFGLERAKWIQNVGATATWLCIALLVVLGGVFAARNGSAQPFSAAALVPDLTDLSILPYFGMVAFCFGGLELAPVLAGEVRDPARTIRRAALIASLAVAAIYVAGTTMVIVTVPSGEIGIIDGVAQSFRAVGDGLGAPWIGPAGAALVVASTLGLFGSWMTGTARIPFVIGLDHYLPDALGRVHARWGSPWVALLVQGGVLSLLFVASVAGATLEEAFLVLLDMSIVLYFIPFLYMFAALVVHVRGGTGKGVVAAFRRDGLAVRAAAGLGFGITLLSAVLATIPSGDVDDRGTFVLKVVGGAALLLGVGVTIYAVEHARQRRAAAA